MKNLMLMLVLIFICGDALSKERVFCKVKNKSRKITAIEGEIINIIVKRYQTENAKYDFHFDSISVLDNNSGLSANDLDINYLGFSKKKGDNLDDVQGDNWATLTKKVTVNLKEDIKSKLPSGVHYIDIKIIVECD